MAEAKFGNLWEGEEMKGRWRTPCPPRPIVGRLDDTVSSTSACACRLVQVRGLVVCLQQLSLTFGTLLAGGINVALQVRMEASESAVGMCRGQGSC